MDTKTGYIILGLGIGQRIGDYLWDRLLSTITNSTVDWTGDTVTVQEVKPSTTLLNSDVTANHEQCLPVFVLNVFVAFVSFRIMSIMVLSFVS